MGVEACDNITSSFRRLETLEASKRNSSTSFSGLSDEGEDEAAFEGDIEAKLADFDRILQEFEFSAIVATAMGNCNSEISGYAMAKDRNCPEINRKDLKLAFLKSAGYEAKSAVGLWIEYWND